MFEWGWCMALVLALGTGSHGIASPPAVAESRLEPRQEQQGQPSMRTAEESLQTRTEALQPIAAAAESTTIIRVFAEGLRTEEGQVCISLFAQADGFPEEGGKCLQWGFARLLGDRAYMVFEPLKPGRYAVAAFHDEDGNGEMRKDWIGRPKEGWGVSRDAQARFGPPDFEAAAFDAVGDTMTVHLQLRY